MFERECDFIIRMTRLDSPPACLDVPPNLDWGFILKTLIDNRMAGLVYWQITRSNIDIPGIEKLESHYRTNQFQNMMLLEEAERILDILNKAGIEVLLTKGLVLLGTTYPLGARRMGDIDLLVRLSQSQAALRIFEGMGFQIGHKDLSSQLGGKNSFDLSLPKGQQYIMVDLSWEFLDNPGRKEGSEFDMEALFEKARSIKLGAVEGRVLDPADQIIHTAAHVSLHHDLNYLPGLVDVAALVCREKNLDWGALESRASFFNLRNAVVCTLGVAQEVYDLTIGEPILKRWRSLKRSLYRSSAILFLDRFWILGAEQESFLRSRKGGLEKKLALTFFRECLTDSLTAQWKSRWRKIWPDRARIWKAYRVHNPQWAVWALSFFHILLYPLFLVLAVPILLAFRPFLGAKAKRRLGKQRFL
jgi:hypothetical protein